eukprot:gnl/MRDRNA2_/MRDRNA2_126348_c0_seq1.p1 gnl/MRDRNA2_/MRDRNA2_126348_c0~~gnl/MRDRNA2_/MRDRNA2_126348_c0_seq1.p1  ORF type:complete len:244 (-),score=12.43 gnl/MRDRNA2_/MRDRNA2_126348_c0_seq1:156-887(-)
MPLLPRNAMLHLSTTPKGPSRILKLSWCHTCIQSHHARNRQAFGGQFSAYLMSYLLGTSRWRGKTFRNLLKCVCGPKSSHNKKSVTKDGACVQHCVGVRTWCYLFRILEDHECGMNHDQDGRNENKIRRAKPAEMASSAPIDANMQCMLQKIREDSKQYSKLHCVRQDHRGFGDCYASNCADKQRPTSATNDKGKPSKSPKPSIPQACVGIWRFGSTTGFLQLRFWIPRVSGAALLCRANVFH